MRKIGLRTAKAADVPDLLNLGAEFHRESNLSHLEYSPVEMAKRLFAAIESENGVLQIAVDIESDKPVGFICAEVDNPYTVERIGFLFLFYVAPQWRGTVASRLLLASVQYMIKELGASAFYASSTAGFLDNGKTDQMLLNLYKKHGFKQLGCFVMKEF